MRRETLVWVESIEFVEELPTHKGLLKIKYKRDNKEIVFIGGVHAHGILHESEDGNHFQLFFEQVTS
jgi:hypothetical protein